MKKGFGWFLAAAALLTPYAAEKNEETGEYEIRSLLLRVKTKTVTDDDGTEHRDCTVNFAGLPTKSDIETIRGNISCGISKLSEGISSCARKVSEAFREARAAKCDYDDFDDEDFENLMIEIGESNDDVREMTIYSMLQRAVYNRMNKDMIDYDKRMDIILGQLKDEFREQAI